MAPKLKIYHLTKHKNMQSKMAFLIFQLSQGFFYWLQFFKGFTLYFNWCIVYCTTTL